MDTKRQQVMDEIRAEQNAQVARDLPLIRSFEDEIGGHRTLLSALMVTPSFYVSLVWAGRLNPHQPRHFMGISIYRTRDLPKDVSWRVI